MDTLLGCDQTKKEQNNAVLAMSALVSAGKRDEAVAFAHEKMALYPGNDMLAVMLASMMMLYDKSDMQAMDRYREGEMLCRRILRDNHDCSPAGDLLRLTAKNTLSHLLSGRTAGKMRSGLPRNFRPIPADENICSSHSNRRRKKHLSGFHSARIYLYADA